MAAEQCLCCTEIALMIAMFLDLHGLSSSAAICRRWHIIVGDMLTQRRQQYANRFLAACRLYNPEFAGIARLVCGFQRPRFWSKANFDMSRQTDVCAGSECPIK